MAAQEPHGVRAGEVAPECRDAGNLDALPEPYHQVPKPCVCRFPRISKQGLVSDPIKMMILVVNGKSPSTRMGSIEGSTWIAVLLPYVMSTHSMRRLNWPVCHGSCVHGWYLEGNFRAEEFCGYP